MPQFQSESWCTTIQMEMSCELLCKSNSFPLTIVEHQDSLRNRDKQQFGNGPFSIQWLSSTDCSPHYRQWVFRTCKSRLRSLIENYSLLCYSAVLFCEFQWITTVHLKPCVSMTSNLTSFVCTSNWNWTSAQGTS